MRKFIIQTKREVTAIMEVECELLRSLDDPSVMWLQPGEYKARILAPKIFDQKIERVVDGKKETFMVPDVWFSHAFYDTLEAAKAQLERTVRSGFEFEIRKGRLVSYTEDQVKEAVEAAEVIML